MAADCKSARVCVRRFESCSLHHFFLVEDEKSDEALSFAGVAQWATHGCAESAIKCESILSKKREKSMIFVGRESSSNRR